MIERPRAIYFIRCSVGGAIKIGITDCIDQRISILQTGCPFKLDLMGCFYESIEASAKTEKELHRRLRRYRIRGEWFRPAGEVIDAVRSLTTHMNKKQVHEQWFFDCEKCSRTYSLNWDGVCLVEDCGGSLISREFEPLMEKTRYPDDDECDEHGSYIIGPDWDEDEYEHTCPY